VRKTAIEVLPKTTATFQAMKKANSFDDKDLRVRLAAVLATTEMKPSAEIGSTLVAVAEKEENLSDNWLRQALRIAGKLNELYFRAEFKKGGLDLNPTLLRAFHCATHRIWI
jgi:hypothetical protein